MTPPSSNWLRRSAGVSGATRLARLMVGVGVATTCGVAQEVNQELPNPDPIQPTERIPTQLPELPAPVVTPPTRPSWQTNPGDPNIITGSQVGTDAVGALTPFGEETSLGPAGPESSVPPALRWGWVTARPYLGYGLTYGTGILAGPQREQNTFINVISPGITLELGRSWAFTYSPSLVIYTADDYNNSLNHAASLSGSFTVSDWSMSFSSRYSRSDNTLVETGSQTEQSINSTSLGAGKALSPVLTLSLGVWQSLRWGNDVINTFSWGGQSSLTYQFHPSTSLGLIVGAGYSTQAEGTDMTDERVQAVITGAITEKLSYSVTGGAEFRQFLNTDASTKISPVWRVNINYEVTPTTTLSLFGTRNVSTSYYSDQFTESFAVGARVSQRLLGRYTLFARGGYRMSDYNSTFAPDTTVQSADYSYFAVGIRSPFLERGSASLSYEWANNSASNEGLGFTSNQISLRLSYGF